MARQKTTRELFRLPISVEQASATLRVAVQNEVEYRRMRFIDSELLQKRIERVGQWLSQRETVGLLLCGKMGNGKTTLLRAITSLFDLFQLKDCNNHYVSMKMVTARDVVQLCRNDHAAYHALETTPLLAIDDMGIESAEVSDYGNVVSPMGDLLSYRYERQLCTIISTNLYPRQIREKYGDRLADRFNEMMLSVSFSEGSYRELLRKSLSED